MKRKWRFTTALNVKQNFLSTKSALKKHSIEHDKVNKELNLNCQQCEKSFQSKTVLKEHVKIAHKVDLNCTTCGKIFSLKSNLKKHMRIVHSEAKEKKRRNVEMKKTKS